ncbi:MAG: YceI family protein [Ferruginibacter sp.]
MANAKWVLDPTHSEIGFKVKHLMISSVTGTFTEFSGTVETHGDDFTTAKASFSANVHSISTNNGQRDAHLKNADFFDADTYPELTFESTSIVKVDEENYTLHGNLSLHGITKQVLFEADFGGTTVDPWGGTRAGFSLKGKISRSDFGISFGTVSETGGILLGDEVKLSAEVQFVKQAAEVAEPVLS